MKKTLNWWNIQKEYFGYKTEKDHVWCIFLNEYNRLLECGKEVELQHPNNEYWEEKINFIKQKFRLTDKIVYEKNDILVVGDLHGNLSALNSFIEIANKISALIIFLGDILDYGQENLKCFEIVYDLCEQGRAICLKSNHERKHFRYSLIEDGGPIVNLSQGNLKTFNEIQILSEEDFSAFNSRLKRFWSKSYYYFNIDNLVFAHAAIPENHWNDHDVDLNYYIHGDSYDKNRNNSWTNYVKKDIIAVVGHTYLNNYPIIKTNDNNGKTVFLDTGSSKGGQLSVMRLKFNEKNYEFVNFFIF
jgi:predicted phosphodiesterase